MTRYTKQHFSKASQENPASDRGGMRRNARRARDKA
jgi:hypothetical protein